MSWFRRKRSSRDPGRAPDAPREPEIVRLHSLALGNLLDRLVAGGAYRFLDLGPAIGSNIDFLSRSALSVQVADLAGTLASPEPRAWERGLESLASGAAGSGYHAVFAWDLLNYLPLERVRELARHLAAATRPGGQVFFLVYYSREMPAEPLRFRIADRETLTYTRPALTRSAPRYPQGVLQQAFPDFHVDRGYLLKTGLQEFLFARDAPAPSEPVETEEEVQKGPEEEPGSGPADEPKPA